MIIHHWTLWGHFQDLVCLDQGDVFVFSLLLTLIYCLCSHCGAVLKNETRSFQGELRGLHQEHHQQVRGDLSPLLSPAETPQESCAQCWAPSTEEALTHWSQSCPGSPRWWRNLRSCHMRRDWERLESSAWIREGSGGIIPMHVNMQWDGLKKTEPAGFQWKDEGQWNTENSL